MRLTLTAFTIIACTRVASAQSLFVVPVSDHPFSADEVTVEKNASNVRRAPARKMERFASIAIPPDARGRPYRPPTAATPETSPS